MKIRGFILPPQFQIHIYLQFTASTFNNLFFIALVLFLFPSPRNTVSLCGSRLPPTTHDSWAGSYNPSPFTASPASDKSLLYFLPFLHTRLHPKSNKSPNFTFSSPFLRSYLRFPPVFRHTHSIFPSPLGKNKTNKPPKKGLQFVRTTDELASHDERKTLAIVLNYDILIHFFSSQTLLLETASAIFLLL